MKGKNIAVLIVFLILMVSFLLICNKCENPYSIKIEDVGYCRDECPYGAMKLYTFWVSDTIWGDIKEHGISQKLWRSEGYALASFYYLKTEGKAVNVTLCDDFAHAVRGVENSGSIAYVWINPDGSIEFRKKDKDYIY